MTVTPSTSDQTDKMSCWSVLLRSILIFGLITHHAQASDGCGYGGHVRCGEECGNSCIYGAGGEMIDRKSDLWCCGAEQCSKSGTWDVILFSSDRPEGHPEENPCHAEV